MPDSLHAKIIFDKPATEDAFTGQGHARTAKGLSEGIDQVFENGGGAIGLEGPFGSGKSTVIGFAEDRLREHPSRANPNAKYHVFTFDLWMHQTDEFRRSLLESFLDFVETAPFPHQVDMEEERDKIRNRKKVVVTENKHRYTANGLALIFALPWLPLLYAWLNPTAFVNNNTLKNAGFIALVVLVAGVLIGGRMVWDTYHRIPESVRGADRTLKDKLVRAGSEFLTISKKVKDEESTQWIRDEDPTTVEFQETFNHLLAKVQVGNNRIVFVLDNIDRLPEDTVKDAWSEMRALFTGRGAKGSQPVVVVVPYDQKVVLDAFGFEEKQGENPPEWDIFTKTFNRILKVSPPVGSHWGAYLEKALLDAFGEQLNDASMYKIIRLLQYDFRSKQQHATPRKIVGFVNELGAYWTQWGELIPIESIAYFVIFRRQIEKDANSLLDPALVANGHSRIVDRDDLLTHLASLHFNVEPKHAVEVLLGDRVINALVDSSPDELVKLKEIEGFGRFFQGYLSEGIEKATNFQPDKIAQAGHNIAALKLEGPLADDVSGVLSDAIPRLTSVGRGNDNVTEGLYSIIRIQPSTRMAAVANLLRSRVAASFEDAKSVGYEEGVAWAQWMTDIHDLIRPVLGESAATLFWEQGMPNNDVHFAIGMAYYCEGRANTRFWDVPQDIKTLQQIVDVIETYVDIDPRVYRDTIAEIIEHLTPAQKTALIDKTASALSAEDREGKPLGYLVDTYWSLDSYFLFSAKLPTTIQLQALITDGTLVYYAYKAHENSEWTTAAKALYLIAKAQTTTAVALSTTSHPVLGSLTEALAWHNAVLAEAELDDNALASLTTLVTSRRRTGIWMTAIKRDGPGGLAESLVTKAIDSADVGVINISTLRDTFEALEEVIGSDKVQALVELKAGVWFHEDIEEDKLISLPLHFLKALDEWDVNPTLANQVVRLDAKLKGISQDEWLEAMTEGSLVVDILLHRIRKSGLTLPPSNFMSPFKEIALKVLEGTLDPDDKSWNDLLKAVPTASRKKVAKSIMAEMRTITTAGAEAFVVNHRDLALLMPLEDEPENAIDRLLRELVASESDVVKDYLRQAKKKYRSALEKVSVETRASFSEVIDGLASTETEGGSGWAQEVRSLLGIKPPKSPPVSDGPDQSDE